MSAASKTTVSAPYFITLSSSLSANDKQVIADLLALLPASYISEIRSHLDNKTRIEADSALLIKGYVDGRGLACPMPLLKTKVALRDIAIGESLYVVATDPNSQADITAFCRQSQTANAETLQLLVNTVTDSRNDEAVTAAGEARHNKAAQQADTIFHFIITKTDSN